MNIKNAHPDDVKIFDESFYRNPKVIKLMREIDNYERSRNYVNAMIAHKKLDTLREKTFEVFMRDYEMKTRNIDLKDADLPDDVRARINQLYICVYITCDIMESIVLDLNDALHKFDMTLTIEQFDELVKLGKSVKQKLNFLQRTDNYMNMDAWGDRCDKVYEFMQQKALAIINAKLREDRKRAKNVNKDNK